MYELNYNPKKWLLPSDSFENTPEIVEWDSKPL